MGLKNDINYLHERAVRLKYDDESSSFQDLLKKITQSINHRNVKALPTEMFKVKKTIFYQVYIVKNLVFQSKYVFRSEILVD